MLKILITGVTGSGASYLAEYLLSNVSGAKIIGTTRNHAAVYPNIQHIQKDIDLQYVDLNDFSSTYQIFDEYRPDIVFHIASMANVRNSFEHPLVVVQNNINITLNLLEAIRLLKHKDGYNPIIQICSTSEVYGSVPAALNPITEETPLKPINPYAVSKLTQDSLGYVYFLNYGLRVIRTRMFSYLNARRADLFATAFAKQIVEIERGERSVLEHGNLDSIRTFIDAREAVASYWIATQRCKLGEVYNIGGSQPIKIGDFLKRLIDKMGVPVVTQQSNKLLRPSDISVQIPDMSKFTRETGWTPKISFEESLDYFVEEVYKFWGKK